MKITVVGNGFDIRHGFKTKYTDFMDAYYDKLRDNVVYQYLYEINIMNGWLDFENQIHDFLVHLSKLFTCITRIAKREPLILDYAKFTTTYEESIFYSVLSRKSYIFLSNEENVNSLIIIDRDWIKLLQDEVENDLKTLNHSLFSYLKEINATNMNAFEKLKTNDIDCICSSSIVYSFNYTNFLERYIDKNKLIYAHGSISDSFENLILGIPYTPKISLSRFFKYFKTNQSVALRKNHLMPLDESTEISFIGFSFGVSDHYFFQEIIDYCSIYTNFSQARFYYKFFYHDEESKHNFISNLRTFFGESRMVSLDLHSRLSFIKYDEV